MAIQVRAEKVVFPQTADASVSAIIAGATALAPAPVVVGQIQSAAVAQPFTLYQEYSGDAGGLATQQTTDLFIPSAMFTVPLTSAENTYLTSHHAIVIPRILPHDLISRGVGDNGLTADQFLLSAYPSSTDANYRTTMQGLVTNYGVNNTYMFMCPEWDNDPSNRGWATNRFTEVTGIGGASRGDLPSGLTRQQAYDQWIHFYTANNHGGIINHHQLGQILFQSVGTRGFNVACNNTQAGTCHYSFEMGMNLVTLQRAEDELSGIVGCLGFIRGAANQYGGKWGVDVSGYRTQWGVGPLTYSGATQTGGWTPATYKRIRHLSYMMGADIIAEEANVWSGSTNTFNGHGYNPSGAEMRTFCDFAFNRHPYAHRGIPHVPIAIMKDHISFFEPRHGQFNQSRNVWWGQMGANAGENMLHSMMDMIWPNYNTWGSSTTLTPEPMGQGRFGEQFDFLTERASAAVMSDYKVIIICMNTAMDATLQGKLNTFVSGGGILVINAKQLTGTAHSTLTGITTTGTASTSGVLTFELDATTTTEGTFNYTTVTLGSATRIANTGGNIPQITRNLVGTNGGQVWTVLPDYMSTPANTLTLGVAAKIVGYLINQFAIGTISGGNHANIDWCVNTNGGASGNANAVMIINTNDAGGTTWTGTVSLPQGSPVAEWITDTVPASSVAAGRTNITASVPAGDVRVYAAG